MRSLISAAIGNSNSSTRKVSGAPATVVPSAALILSALSSTTSEPESIEMMDWVSVDCAVKLMAPLSAGAAGSSM
ncbi:Uncharacterised protein [Mycobacteroides abscessus subsp. abscessus]|nr:Uncharacterised protein [Mycobacteroides abscessus subsp. abscessus]